MVSLIIIIIAIILFIIHLIYQAIFSVPDSSDLNIDKIFDEDE